MRYQDKWALKKKITAIHVARNVGYGSIHGPHKVLMQCPDVCDNGCAVPKSEHLVCGAAERSRF